MVASISDKKGFGFEYLVSGLFQKQGYLARRGIPLQYGNNKTDVTDIDVLGIRFNELFQAQRVICDCKNKVKSKPYERIFWASGLGNFVGADEIFVALPKTQNEIIEFAHSGGVRIITNDFISNYFVETEAKGLSDFNYFEDVEKQIELVGKENKAIQDMLLIARKQFLNRNPYIGVNIALDKLTTISKWLKYQNTNSIQQKLTLKYLTCQYTVLVCIHLLGICADVMMLPEGIRKKRIMDKITYGEIEPIVAKTLIEDSKNLAFEMLKASLASDLVPQQIDLGEIEPPDYAESLIGLIERAISKPAMYISLPNIMDFILFERDFKEKQYTELEISEISGYYQISEKIKATKNVQFFISEYCHIDWGKVFSN